MANAELANNERTAATTKAAMRERFRERQMSNLMSPPEGETISLQRVEERDQVVHLRVGQEVDRAVEPAAALLAEPVAQGLRTARVDIGGSPADADQGRHLELASGSDVLHRVVGVQLAAVAARAREDGIGEERLAARHLRLVERARRG